jgi:hypothetical protein
MLTRHQFYKKLFFYFFSPEINTEQCKSQTRKLKTVLPIDAFFTKRPANFEPAQSQPKAKVPIQEVLCASNTDETWERPRATNKIINCILGSATIYHGGPP